MASMIQPMPPLSTEQLEALRGDIAANGVLVPVTLDQHGRIIDGNNRAAIADELGIEYPTVVIEVADDEAATNLALTLNCARRHLTQDQKRELIGSEIERRPDDSDRAIAKRLGCSPTTVGTVRKAGKVSRLDTLTDAERAKHEASVETLKTSIADMRGAIYALVGMALTNRVSVPEVIGALTMAKLQWQRRHDRDPEVVDFVCAQVWDVVIDVTTWPETAEQYSPHPYSDPTPEEHQMLIDSILMMGLPSGQHPADVGA